MKIQGTKDDLAPVIELFPARRTMKKVTSCCRMQEANYSRRLLYAAKVYGGDLAQGYMRAPSSHCRETISNELSTHI